jgi:stage IV sporulation protein A
MEHSNIYKEIATRSGGDIYLGVVGPVRTGKSTFITNFVNQLILPNIANTYAKQRTIDELPQSAQGKTIMTTEPKFVPNEAASIDVDDIKMKVRLIDCVGYSVKGASGYEENEKPRFVKTPWSNEDMPFDKAAEIGTQKVISEHSNVAVLVTTDGSFTEIDRTGYVNAEERVVAELKDNQKPFVILLNTIKPNESETKKLAESLSQKYSSKVLALNVKEMTEDDIAKVFNMLLEEFPVNKIQVKMPKWMEALPFDNALISEIVTEIKQGTDGLEKIGDFKLSKVLFENSENFEPLSQNIVELGNGNIVLNVTPKQDLFYKVLSDECGVKITSDYELIANLKDLSYAKKEYDKLKVALDEVNETGYGVVVPSMEEMTLEDPEIVKQGSKFGVRLKASAPSLHIMKVDINTEVSPIVGTEQQSEDLVKYLLSQFENNPQGIWNTEMFGKSLHELVNEGLSSKLCSMPKEAQKKMRKTLGRIVNEGKGGVICILL